MAAAYHTLVRTIARALRPRCAVPSGARLVVATSGGADSVALLRALHLLTGRRSWGLKLVVGHVQHHLRDDAEADAQFVESLAHQLNLPYERADVHPRNNGGNVEATARRLRYDALHVMAVAADAQFVVTAHHGDDQLETMLMRIMRGASVRGLAGMRWRRRLQPGSDIKLIRPMLGAQHADAIDLCNMLGQAWREDHTNADTSRTRARLRGEVMPVLQVLQADVSRKGVLLAEHLRACARLVEREVYRAADRVRREGERLTLDRVDARLLPTIVLTGLLRRLLTEMGVGRDDLRASTVRSIARAIHDTRGGQRRFDLACSVTVIVTRDTVVITRIRGDD